MSNELQIAEVGALRDEVNSIIDRMNGNENFSAGSISAIYAFVLSNDYDTISVLLSFLAIIIVAIGVQRNKELQHQIVTIDDYLKDVEISISPNGGWVNHYSKKIKDPTLDGFSKTRIAFWLALGAISVIGFVYLFGHLIGFW